MTAKTSKLEQLQANLNARQTRFAQEYVRTLNGYQSAVKAGYSPISAGPTASRLLSHHNVKALIAALQEKMAAKYEVSAEKIIAELARMGFSNMEDYLSVDSNGEPVVDLSALDRDKASAIQEVTIDSFLEGKGEDAKTVKRIRFKLCDKRAALVDLGKHLNLFKERLALEGKDGGPIQHETVTAYDALMSRLDMMASRTGKTLN